MIVQVFVNMHQHWFIRKQQDEIHDKYIKNSNKLVNMISRASKNLDEDGSIILNN